MAIFKAVVRRPRKDGFWQAYIRVGVGTEVGYIATEKERLANIEQSKATLEHWKKIASTNSRRQEAIQAGRESQSQRSCTSS